METKPQEFGDPRFPFAGDAEGGSLIEIDLRRILDVLNRNKLWVIGIVALAILLGVVATFLAVPRYVATARVLVETQSDQIIEGSELKSSADSWDTERFLQTQIDIIESRSLAKRVVADRRLADDDAFFAAFGADRPTADDAIGVTDPKSGTGRLKQVRADLAADLLQGALSTELPLETRVIPISVETIDPAYSAKLANAYAEGYMKANLEQKFDSSAYARDFLAGQLEEARARLATSERDLNVYSRAAGLIRVTNQGNQANTETTLSVTNNSLVQVNDAASHATAERIAAEDRWKTIDKEPVLSIPQVLQNPAVQDMIKEKTKVQTSLAEERARHLDGHPAVQAMEAQVTELERRIQSIGGSIKRSVYLDYKAALDKEKSLMGRVESLRSAALDEQDQGVQYSVLKRVADTNRALYDSLLARFNELSASAGAASNNVTLVDAAEVPRGPSSPNLLLNILVALLAGVVLASIVVVLREHFDDVIRTPEDLESRLGLPILGVIPVAESDVQEELRVARSPISEAYHTLVTNLMYATSGGLPECLLVTSSSEGQGKSTTATAVALDLARLGRSVLLIDADMRRPTLHLMLESNSDIGLAALLAGQAELESALLPGPEKNLTCMTALPIPPDPSRLLGNGRLDNILARLRERFDVIVVDGPPMLGLSDAALLASHVDGVLVIVDASQFHRAAVKGTLRRLALVNARKLGAVVTKFNPEAAGGEYSYYGRGYYHHEPDVKV